jgi:hypothetical protein
VWSTAHPCFSPSSSRNDTARAHPPASHHLAGIPSSREEHLFHGAAARPDPRWVLPVRDAPTAAFCALLFARGSLQLRPTSQAPPPPLWLRLGCPGKLSNGVQDQGRQHRGVAHHQSAEQAAASSLSLPPPSLHAAAVCWLGSPPSPSTAPARCASLPAAAGMHPPACREPRLSMHAPSARTRISHSA